MNKSISDLVKQHTSASFATANGNVVHNNLRHVFIGKDKSVGDAELIKHIQSVAGLAKMFGRDSRTEVPVAHIVNGRLISRRIDRLYIDENDKTVYILDYKTDTDMAQFKDKYIAQLGEYRNIMAKIYPNYTIKTYILWVHNWMLESI